MLIKMQPNHGHVIFTAKFIEEYGDNYVYEITECEERPHIIGMRAKTYKRYFDILHQTKAVELFLKEE